MIILKDNTKYDVTGDDLWKYMPLQNFANRNISEILDEYGKTLLIYPYSFYHCEDEIGKQPLLSIQGSWTEKSCTKLAIETGNIAGFFGINGESYSIYSRFSKNETDDYFLQYMLSKVLCINVVNLMHGTSHDRIFDFMLFLFPRFLNDALAQGVYKEYQHKEYNDANLRGVIDINKHIKRNIPFNGRIAYHTREFSHDNNLTELIRHTIDYISNNKIGKSLLEDNEETRINVSQIIAATPSYCRQDRNRILKNNLKTVNHPYYSHYTPLQKLCVQILRHEEIKYGGENDKIKGILFDVSYLWEEYLATLLMKQGFVHPENKIKYNPVYLAKPKKLPRYPDFYRISDYIIADAKYKKNINRDDIHQIITYMYTLKGTKGIFIQPTDNENDQSILFELNGYGEEDNAELKIYPYLIPGVKNDYKQFVSEIEKSENRLAAIFIQ